MIKRRILSGVAAAISSAMLLAGCNTSTTMEPVIGSDGKPVTDAQGNVVYKKTVDKESPLRHKTFSAAGSVTALDVETTMSGSGDSSATPHVIIGGSAASVSSASEEDNKPTIGYSWSAGVLTSLTSSSATSGAITYTGIKGETAEQTRARLKAIVDFKNGNMSDSTTVDSGTSK